MCAIEADRRDLDIHDREQEIPEEEKRQILDQIEKSISESGLPAASGIQPQKKGFVFPLIVNLSALILLIAAVFGAVRMFEVRREKLNLEIRVRLGSTRRYRHCERRRHVQNRFTIGDRRKLNCSRHHCDVGATLNQCCHLGGQVRSRVLKRHHDLGCLGSVQH